MLVLPIMAFGQSATATLPDPGLTPDSPFYFLNRVGEALQEFFTFNPEAKARLQLEFATERISEIKAMLIEKGAALPAIEVARARLTENLAKASQAVVKVKTSGKDVAELAKEVSEKISSQKLTLKGVFGEELKNISEKEKALKEKIKEADKLAEVEKAKEFVKDLDKLNSERESIKKHDDESSQDFDIEDENVDNALELKDKAQNAINDAKKARAELLVEIPEITVADLALADKAIASAEDLFAKENYQAAKELADQAEKALERAKEMLEKKSEGDEKENELIKKYKEIQDESAKKLDEVNKESAQKLEEASKESSEKLQGVSFETAKKLEEINRENEKKQLELNNEIEKLSSDLDKATSTED